MRNHEIESKLNQKVEKWEFHALQTENGQLKNRLNELEIKIEQLKSQVNNRHYALEGLFNLIAVHPKFSEFQNQIYELKQSL